LIEIDTKLLIATNCNNHNILHTHNNPI